MGLTEVICIEVIVVICNLWKTFQVYQPIITATNKQLEANGNQASLFNYVIELIKIGQQSKNRSSEKSVDVSVGACVCCLHASVDVCDSAHPCWKTLVRQCIAAVGPRLSSTSRPK